MTLRLWLYNLLFPLAFPLFLPGMIRKLYLRGGAGKSYLERFGFFSETKQKHFRNQSDRPILIHAASVGEVQAAFTFINAWLEEKSGQRFVLSVTTSTGHAVACKKATSHTTVIFSSLDFYPIIRRLLNLIRPAMIIIFEVEIWPNLITLSHRTGIPVILANGRLSDNSAKGYQKHKWFFGPLLDQLDLLCVQTKEDKARLQPIVSEDRRSCIHVCNTMKFDQTTAHAEPRDALLITCFGADEHRFLIGASTHPGEENLLLQSFISLQEKYPDLRLILAPRHHERTPEVIQSIKSFDLTYECLTNLENNATENAEARLVLLINTTGELVNFFPNADIVYMGKTFCNNTGGHNIIEPALFAKPIVHGPHMENFRKVAACFQSNQATTQVNHETDLETAIDRLLTSPEASNAIGSRAYQTVQDNRGAVETTIALIAELLESGNSPIGR